MTPLLEVSELRTHIRGKRTVTEAVDGVSFTIEAGETLGLVGESGCGKSMTGMSIMQLLPPGGFIAGGSVRLDGRELTSLSDKEMRHVRGDDVAVVFQDPMTSLNPTMTIGDQIAGPVRAHRGASRAQARERAVEVLSLVGMPSPRARLGSYPHQLSGGLRQRVMIAMALACEPRVLIADEPTTALDVTIQAQILDLLDSLRERLAMGVLLITHDMGVIAGRADRVMVMYAGRVVESAETGALFAGMRHPYTEALIESIPDLQTDRSDVLYTIPGLPPDLTDPPRGCRFAPRCRYAQDRCRGEDPALGGPDSAHPYACFYPVDGGRARPGDRGERGERPVGEAVADQVIEAEQQLAAVQEAVESAGAAAPTASDPATSAREPLLVVDDAVKDFPLTRGVLQRRIGAVHAVSGVSLEVAAGETFGLVGESGCGKTTLGRLIVGLDKPDSGSVRVDGQATSGLRGAARRRLTQDVQFMFQDPYTSLDPRMRVRATLREPLQAQHIGGRAQQEARILQLLGEVGLAERALSLFPHEFSGGQRQRIGFARALTTEPKLIVADEPVSALDVSIQSQVLNLMKRLQVERELTYLIISHDLSVVRYLADRIGVMYLGKLVEVGPGGDVYERPAHPYTAALLEAIPLPDPGRERAKRAGARSALGSGAPADVGPGAGAGAAPLGGELPSAVDPPSGCRFRTRCPRAQDVCAEVEPPLRAFGVAAHRAACHFPLVAPLDEGHTAGTTARPGVSPS